MERLAQASAVLGALALPTAPARPGAHVKSLVPAAVAQSAAQARDGAQLQPQVVAAPAAREAGQQVRVEAAPPP